MTQVPFDPDAFQALVDEAGLIADELATHEGDDVPDDLRIRSTDLLRRMELAAGGQGHLLVEFKRIMGWQDH